jgi:hypothetical protein
MLEVVTMVIYEIIPNNFIMLSERHQDELINYFNLLLNSLSFPIRIIMMKKKQGIMINDKIITIDYPSFFIECKDPIDDILEANHFVFQKLEKISIPNVRIEKWNSLILEDGRLAKCFTLYELPAILPIGFLSEVYDITDIIQVMIIPMESEEAIRKVENYKRTLNAIISSIISKKRSPNQNLLLKREIAEKTINEMIMGISKLFKVSTNFIIIASSQKELKEKSKLLINRLNSRLIKVDSPKLIQGLIYEGKGKFIYMNTSTLSAFYPFVSGEVIESGGVFLGINVISGAPVIYNPLLRQNSNISIIGTSGSGKSFLSKILLKRLIENYPDIPFYVIDPEGEYTPLIEWLGGEVIHVDENMELGLDPLILFEKGEAADIICDIVGLNERKDISRVRDIVMSSKNLNEFFDKLPSDLSEKFSSIKRGPESFIFKGEPIVFTSRMSFNMRRIESKLIKQIFSLLIFGKIWQIISKPNIFGITKTTPRLVLIDEAWLYMEIPSAATFLEKVARLGRKRNCILIINTQRPADMLGTNLEIKAGRTILENSSTKILMRQDDSNKILIKEVFGLSDQEADIVVEFPQGEGLLITDTIHIRVQFLATSDEEYQLLTTKPSEII